MEKEREFVEVSDEDESGQESGQESGKESENESGDEEDDEPVKKKISIERVDKMKIESVHKIMKENDVKIHEYNDDEENEEVDLKNKYRLFRFISKNDLFLDEDEKKLYKEKAFKELYLTPFDQLKKLCKRNDVGTDDTRYDIIQNLNRMMKYVKIVRKVEPITDRELQIVRLRDNKHKFYVCGTATYKNKDGLKGLQASWDTASKSWSFGRDRLDLFINFVIKNTTQYDEDVDDTISDDLDIEKVSSLPPPERGVINVYQMNNRVYLVGYTYSIRNLLNEIGPSHYDKETKSTSFPGRFAGKVIETLDKYQSDKVEAEQARRQEEKERKESLAKEETLADDDVKRLEKLISRALLGKKKPEERKEIKESIKELKKKWSKFITVEEVDSPSRGNTKVKSTKYFVTYDGDICPPYIAMKLAADDWNYKNDRKGLF